MSLLTFDPALHRYALSGRRVRSVTQILRLSGVMKPNPFWTEEARERGEKVHTVTAEFDTNSPKSSFDRFPEVGGYLDSWRIFLSETRAKILDVEKRVYNARLDYAGTFDRLLRIGGAEWIIDIKTSEVCEPWHSLQEMLYAMTFPAWPLRGCVHLSADGYKFIPHTEPEDYGIALAAPYEAAVAEINGRRGTYYSAEQARLAEASRVAADAARKSEEDSRLAVAASLERQGRAAEASAVLSTPVIATAPVLPAAPKAKGTSTREVVKARLISLPILAQAIVSGKAPVTLIAFDEAAANKFAASTAGSVAVPGIEYYKETIFADRTR